MIENSRLVLVLERDVDDEGNSIKINRTFNRVKTDASNEGLKEVAEALASLQIYPLLDVMRIDQIKLV
ncbi:Protein of unknown function [Anaerobranca californiensis DSM 14826]|jgi:hypothetical protein|uniref:DUF1659 domain-containing protein n=1 Tax=Anaerobranca californiensis DSM 14826 TaxID=1120989 RepID=A0A1M6Q2S4_9FIRM|nr:DUF1659 domain-containing protein [Anaerobranca californiensis]SHK14488.1 Protein of unknown function [Anaerobranca californiensis DSM 14826]